MDKRASYLFVTALIVASLSAATAEERTTPVEVKNTPGVSVTNSPTVSVGNTPSVTVTNTPNVAVANSPTVKIDATTNTVQAQQSGTWNVGISPTDNLVQTQVKSQKVLFLSQDTPIAQNAGIGKAINCRGYKEARVFLFVDATTAVAEKLYVSFYWDGLGIGGLYWAKPGGYPSTVTNHPGFVATHKCFSIVLPVFGDSLNINIQNQSDTGITLRQSFCWVYLVN